MVIKYKFNEQCITYSQMNFIFNSRILWRRFTIWLRAYIISRYAELENSEEIFNKLYLEALNFGDMLQVIFGRENANNYSQLVSQYVYGFRDLISAQMSGDTESVYQLVNFLYKNAADRASFLTSINPYLNEAEWRDLLGTYIRYSIDEANSFITGNYSKEIASFDRLTELTNRMGYVFAQALYDYMNSNMQYAIHPTPVQCITVQEMNRIYDIRMFWFELIIWVRSYILSRLKGLGNENEVYARLMQVPARYVNMLQQIFQVNLEPYLQLLNTFIDLINSLVTAQMEGNVDEVNRITQLLYENADEGAAFLASINPFWDQNEWRSRLDNILQSIIDETITLSAGDHARNLEIYSNLLDQAESISSYFADGLFKYMSSQGR